MITSRDVLSYIFSFCDAQTLGRAACACKQFHKIIYSELFWQTVFTRSLESGQFPKDFPAKKISLPQGKGNVVPYDKDHILYSKNFQSEEKESEKGSKICLFNCKKEEEIEIGCVPILDANCCTDGDTIIVYGKCNIFLQVQHDGQLRFEKFHRTEDVIENLWLTKNVVAWTSAHEGIKYFEMADITATEWNSVVLVNAELYDMVISDKGVIYLSYFSYSNNFPVVGCFFNGFPKIIARPSYPSAKLQFTSNDELFLYSSKYMAFINVEKKKQKTLPLISDHDVIEAETLGNDSIAAITTQTLTGDVSFQIIQHSGEVIFSKKLLEKPDSYTCRLWMTARKILIFAGQERFALDFSKNSYT